MAVLKDLIVHGASRFINLAQYTAAKGNTIAADEGIFNKLVATKADIADLDVTNLTAQNAKVMGLLDVQGELHTNKWTNANIANIGGSFYISPTVSTTIASNGTPMTVTITGTSGNRTIAVSGGNFVTDAVKIYSNSTTTTASWEIGSHVMITGSVRLGTTGVDYPLGTCSGYLTAALATGGFTLGEVNSAALESIISELGTSLKSYELSISMFEIGPKASIKPVGIMMTSYGVDKSTYLDIYGGVNPKDSSTGYIKPNVRIGYLDGIAQYQDSAGNFHKPTGWGIYTDNGYFTGVVVADSGLIGGWTIDSESLYSSQKDKWDKDISGIFIGKNEYFLTNDTEKVSGKTYYKFINGNYVIYTSTASFSPVQEQLYEKRDDFFTISGGRNQYVLVDDTEVNENTTYYEIIYVKSQDTTVDETKTYYSKESDEDSGYYKYIPILNPTGNPSSNNYYEKTENYSVVIIQNEAANPQKLGWYKNLGPMWYINSDGTANFGSLIVNQYGDLNVPAAAISGKLTAAQIEVDSLWAGNATIGATVDSEITSSNFKADLESTVIPSSDTRVVPGKDYYIYRDNYEEITLGPDDSPFEKYYVETEVGSGTYVLSYDVEPVAGTTYYELKGSTLVLEDDLPSGTSPVENNYYEKIDSSYIILRTEKKNYVLTDDLEVINEKDYYSYNYTYFLSEDEKVEKDKNYYENIKELTSDTTVVSSKTYYEKIGEGSEAIYKRIDGTGVNPSAKGWYQDAYVLIPLDTSEDTSGDISIYVPASLNWYEKRTEYVLVEQPQDIIQSQSGGATPRSLNWYEIESEYSAEVNLKNGDIFISSNDQIVLSTDSKESDLNVNDVDVLKRIKFGNIELIPYEGGFAIKAGGETN